MYFLFSYVKKMTAVETILFLIYFKVLLHMTKPAVGLYMYITTKRTLF